MCICMHWDDNEDTVENQFDAQYSPHIRQIFGGQQLFCLSQLRLCDVRIKRVCTRWCLAVALKIQHLLRKLQSKTIGMCVCGCDHHHITPACTLHSRVRMAVASFTTCMPLPNSVKEFVISVKNCGSIACCACRYRMVVWVCLAWVAFLLIRLFVGRHRIANTHNTIAEQCVWGWRQREAGHLFRNTFICRQNYLFTRHIIRSCISI